MPVDISPNTIRIRVKPPTGYSRFRVKDLGKGIKAVIGFKAGGGSEIQSYIFDKKAWDLTRAKAWVKAHKTEKAEGFFLIEYAVPIEGYSGEFDTAKDFWIQGTAINETITRNDVKYTAEELEPAAASLKGRPILKDHKNEVDAIIGKVTDSFFDKEGRKIPFKGKIMDKGVQELIKDGRLSTVSIGARVREMEEGEDYNIAKGIEIMELSVVAVPGDPNATFDRALAESINEKDIVCKESYDMFEQDKPDKEDEVKDKEPRDEPTGEKTLIKKKSESMEKENMEEETKLKELQSQLEAKEEKLKTAEKRLLDIAETERKSLVETYKKLAEEKQMTCMEDTDKLGKETLNALIEMLKGIKVEKKEDIKVIDEKKKTEAKEKKEMTEKIEVKKEIQKTKGLIGEEKSKPETTKDLIMETLNEGVAFYREPSENGSYSLKESN